MAELTSFSFRSGTSLLHQLDVRCKMVLLVFFSMACMHAGFLALGVFTPLVIYLIINACLPLKSVFKEIRYFFVLLAGVFAARVLTASGAPILTFYFVTLSRHGIYDATLVCWRLLLIVLLGLLLVATTRSSQIKVAVEWFLRPVPFFSGRRTATMLSLIMRFVPVILNQARQTAEAQKARAVENRKNPIYRLKYLGIPLLRRAFEDADKLVVAMEARCFSDRRTDPRLAAGLKDWITLSAGSLFCILIILL
jgi:energy-coupling factor transporter transmembrane protein EcfT